MPRRRSRSRVYLQRFAILIHELGHAFATARLHRTEIRIVLHSVGGVTTYYGVWPTRKEQIAIALAGPATGLCLAALVRIAALTVPSFCRTSSYGDVMFVTLGWSLLNLVPALPLDGGAIVMAFLRNERRVMWISVAVALSGAVACKVLDRPLLLGLFAILAIVDLVRVAPLVRDRR